MCDCHSILECCVVFSGVKLSIRSFNLFPLIFSTFVNYFELRSDERRPEGPQGQLDKYYSSSSF